MFYTKFSKLVLAFLLISVVSFAQNSNEKTLKEVVVKANHNCPTPKPVESPVVKEFKSKVTELYTKYKLDGFVTYKGGDLPMENKTEFPIFVDLKEGSWYQFVVVGDPNAIKFEMKLGLEGVGDFITDKFKEDNTNEYWTQFSFICPRSGRYLLTFYQRGSSKQLLGHVGILQRPRKTTEGIYTFKN